jgi:hypothetical protein
MKLICWIFGHRWMREDHFCLNMCWRCGGTYWRESRRAVGKDGGT